MEQTTDARWRGRDRAGLEDDVLGCMVTVTADRQFAADVLRESDFTSARRRAIFRHLAKAPDGVLDEAEVARALAESPSTFVAWLHRTAPSGGRRDIAFLVEVAR